MSLRSAFKSIRRAVTKVAPLAALVPGPIGIGAMTMLAAQRAMKSPGSMSPEEVLSPSGPPSLMQSFFPEVFTGAATGAAGGVLGGLPGMAAGSVVGAVVAGTKQVLEGDYPFSGDEEEDTGDEDYGDEDYDEEEY